MQKYSVVVIGAGAAGLMAAAAATQNHKSVAVLDMSDAVARKVAISGGTRCNFTNDAVAQNRYFGENPAFVRSAISRVTPADILDWAQSHNITPVEKSRGQYFCATGAADVVAALMRDARAAKIILRETVVDVTRDKDCFIVRGEKDSYLCASVIVATGGISFPVVGVSDIGYKIAKKFGHKIVPVRPALCAIATNVFSGDLSGISMPVEIRIGTETLTDSMLFTHFGLGGPAIYRATVRDINQDIHINLMPDVDAYNMLRAMKQTAGKKSLYAVLSQYMPIRVAKIFDTTATKHIADYKDSELVAIAQKISDTVIPRTSIKLHGLPSAEVVRGGVSTAEISSKTMESKLCSGLYFAGEVIDVAGDLGGFNLHWAWASGRIAGQNA